MKIAGFEKLSLVDYDGYTACTVFTPGCNLRCPFCQNAALLGSAEYFIPEEEIFAHLKRRKGLIDAICISGGEPTLFSDLPDFIRQVRSYGVRVKLDTNGTNPDMLGHLLSENLLDYVAMDIKNAPAKYDLTAGVAVDFSKIEQSIALLKNARIDYEFRTTVVAEFHTEEDIREICRLIDGAPAYFLQQFRDRDTNLQDDLHAHDEETFKRFGDIARPHFKRFGLRGL